MLGRFITCAIVSFLFPTLGSGADNLPQLGLKPVFASLKVNRPLALAESPDGTGRWFLMEQAGKILILPKDRASADTKTFLDIVSRRPFVMNEEGLLGMAFHPQFKTNGKFYIYYSQQNPLRTVLSEIQVAKSNPDAADLASERILMQINHPYWNHKGGALNFGPDGCLYLALGDGGSGGDPHNFGQNLNTLLGKILRLDVDSRTGDLPYGIPKDNPFVDRGSGARGEIWAYGLRNVWRMSFDRENGELWAGEVGQNKFEEVSLIVKGGNYGWSIREGFHAFKNLEARDAKFIEPVIEYGHTPQLAGESKFPEHSHGISITGGYVYRGKKLPALRGVYVYADYQFGTIWGLRHDNGKLTGSGTLVKSNPARNISSFAEDAAGEIYVLAFDGKIYEFVEAN
jgi:glucose/arabinose dehydrogenase